MTRYVRHPACNRIITSMASLSLSLSFSLSLLLFSAIHMIHRKPITHVGRGFTVTPKNNDDVPSSRFVTRVTSSFHQKRLLGLGLTGTILLSGRVVRCFANRRRSHLRISFSLSCSRDKVFTKCLAAVSLHVQLGWNAAGGPYD